MPTGTKAGPRGIGLVAERKTLVDGGTVIALLALLCGGAGRAGITDAAGTTGGGAGSAGTAGTATTLFGRLLRLQCSRTLTV